MATRVGGRACARGRAGVVWCSRAGSGGAARGARARVGAGGGGTIVSKEGFARARDRRETRETDGDSYAL
jgi:hypothetical protein